MKKNLKMVHTHSQIIGQLTKVELVGFIQTYDKYVAEFYEDHDYPDQPVGILEYFNNEYMDMLNGDYPDEGLPDDEQFNSLDILEQIGKLYRDILASLEHDAIQEADDVIYDELFVDFEDMLTIEKCELFQKSGKDITPIRDGFLKICKDYNIKSKGE